MKRNHFVLVHGTGHGAWCWFKLVTLLKEKGHRVTALDLGEPGPGPGPGLDKVSKTSFDEYVEPLMSFMRTIDHDHHGNDEGGDDDEKKVILVGHSFGGFAISMAMQKYPEKIQVAVFVSAFMPSCSSPPITLFQEAYRRTPKEELLDSTFLFDKEDTTPVATVFGPEFLARKLYQNCQPEDVELAKMLVKPAGLFNEGLAKEGLLTEDGFGSVDRVYIACEEDEVLKLDFQKWIIQESPPNRVISIPKADHMVMLSKPTQLSQSLLQIAQSSEM